MIKILNCLNSCLLISLHFIIELMNMENSSKYYPKIVCQKQEKNQIQILINGQAKVVKSRDFFELTQIVRVDNIPQLKNLGLYSLVYNQNNLIILHIFLYYCAKVQLQLQIMGLQQHYLKQLRNLYINCGFNIQIGKYAKLVSALTGMQIKKCAHIIYYLIYARLAANSYINQIISQESLQNRKKKQKLKTILSARTVNKRQNLTMRPIKTDLISQSSSFETKFQQLAEDLKQIFRNTVAQKTSIRKTNFQNFDDTIYKTDTIDASQNIELSKKYYVNYEPIRVSNGQKSAIVQNLKQSCNKSYFKLMRKRKFDQTKLNKMLYKTFTFEPKKNDQHQKQNANPTIKREKAIKYTQNIIKTNYNFKNTSEQLNKIRYTLSKARQKVSTSNQLSLANSDPDNSIGQFEKSYLQLKLKVQSMGKSTKCEIKDCQKMDYEDHNRFTSLLRKQQKGKTRAKRTSYYDFQHKNNLKLKTNEEMDKSIPQSKKMQHIHCQKRLNLYKNQFRRFVKVHLFKSNENN